MAYSLEFKKQVIEEFRSGKTITEISDKYNLAPSTVFFWNKHYENNSRYFSYGTESHLSTQQLTEKYSKLQKECKELRKLVSELDLKIKKLEEKNRRIIKAIAEE